MAQAVQMIRKIPCGERSLSYQRVEMQGERFNPFPVAEGHVVAAGVDHGKQRAKDGDRGRVELTLVVKVDAQPWVELGAEVVQLVELAVSFVVREVGVVAGSGGEALQLINRQGNLVVGLCGAHPVQPVT